jgi:glycosyltransferase involved in cell wall biosynthesis
MKPYISLCMIVKNEEKVLSRCLESVFEIVDEIIIIDTGSSDSTKEVASQYTKHVYDYTWTGSFSKARNFAHNFATGEWILALDADEYVDRENLKDAILNIKETTKLNPEIDAFSVKIFNFTGIYGENIFQHHHSRIYKNDGNIEYYRDIHEQLQKTNGEVLQEIFSTLHVYHSGYLNSTVKSKEKNKRNTELLKAEMKKSGNSGFDYFNLGNEYQSMGKIEEALDAYKKAFVKKPDIRYSWVPYTIIQIVNCLIKLTRYDEALKVITDAEQMYTKSPEFKCLKSNIYITQNRWEDAKEVLTDVINNKKHFDKCIMSIDYLEFIPYKLLGNIFESEKDFKNAVSHYSQALSFNRTNKEVITRILYILSNYNVSTELYSFIEKQNWLNDQEILKTIIRTMLNNGKVEIARNYINILDSEVDVVGFKIKSEIVNGNFYDAYHEIKGRSLQDIKRMLNKKLIDFYDLILLGLIHKETNLLQLFYQVISNNDEKMFIELLLQESADIQLDKPEYLLTLMEKSILLKQFEVFESLIPLRTYYDESINLSIGHLLYRSNFEDIAISFYQEIADIEKFDDEAFVNIIKEFIKKDEINDALDFTLLAISQKRKDFRIYKFGIELLNKQNINDSDIETLLKIALETYPDSNWLKDIFVFELEGELK